MKTAGFPGCAKIYLNICVCLATEPSLGSYIQRRLIGLIVDLRDIFVVGISFKSWKPFFHCHVIRWIHDEQRTVYICLVTRVFPVDLKLECTVIEKTLKNTSLDENVAITLQKSLYFTEIEVWLTIDNSEIDVLLEQLSASNTWIYRFDESWVLL